MATLVLEPNMPEIEALKERRRLSGIDRLDEVWEGVLHMVPAPSYEHARLATQLTLLLDGPARAAGLESTVGGFNLGESEEDFRVPDMGLHRPGASGVWHPTVALAVEIVSPNDETWQKLPFYAAHDVDEVLIVDPAERKVHWLARVPTSQSPRFRVFTSQSTEEPGNDAPGYRETDRSSLIDLGPAELAAAIEWP